MFSTWSTSCVYFFFYFICLQNILRHTHGHRTVYSYVLSHFTWIWCARTWIKHGASKQVLVCYCCWFHCFDKQTSFALRDADKYIFICYLTGWVHVRRAGQNEKWLLQQTPYYLKMKWIIALSMTKWNRRNWISCQGGHRIQLIAY